MAGIALRIVGILRQYFAGAAVAKIRRGRNLTITRVTRYKMANRLVYNIDFYERLFRRERVFRDRTMPFDIYDERQMIERYRFGKDHLMDDLCGARSAIGIRCRKAWRHSAYHSAAGDPAHFSVWRVPVGCGGSIWLCQISRGPLFHRVVGVLAARLRQSAK